MKISFIRVVLILLIRFCVSQFHQDDYDIDQHRFEITEINKTACSNLVLKMFKYNDTLKMKAINFTIDLKQEVRKNVLLTGVVFKFVQKKYRAFPFPDITIDLCEQFVNLGGKNPFGIQTAIKQSNFRGCPLAAGFYYVDTWIIDQEKFPPHMPGGEYMIGLKVQIDDDIFLFHANAFSGIVTKKKKKH